MAGPTPFRPIGVAFRAFPEKNRKVKPSRMSMLDLIKATITCGGIAFLVYNYPALSQGVIIGLLTLL